MKRNKLSTLIVVFVLMGFSFLTVGYAALTSTIDFNGTVAVGMPQNVYVDSIVNVVPVNNAVENYNPNIVDTHSVTVNADLPQLNSSISYYIKVFNNTPNAYKLTSVHSTATNDNTEYIMFGLDDDYIINSYASAIVAVKIKYRSSVITLPANTEAGYNFEFIFSVYAGEPITTYSPYVTDNIILNLKGYEPSITGFWSDDLGNVITLNGDAYHNIAAKSFEFDGNGDYGIATTSSIPVSNTHYTPGKLAFIPETADFTLEVYVKTPMVLTGTIDAAIVSQISHTAKSTSRFKLNIKKDATAAYTKPGFASFLHDSKQTVAANANVTTKFITGIETNTQYLLQLVRTGKTLRYYVNGNQVNIATLAAVDTPICQEAFQIGMFYTGGTQYFTGAIHAIRVYDAALDTSDLLANYNSDLNNYSAVVIIPRDDYIKNNAVAYSFANEGQGLYVNTSNDLIYTGPDPKNYLKLNGTEYRIISFDDDGYMKIMLTDPTSSLKLGIKEFDTDENREIRTPFVDTYCSRAANACNNPTCGCNLWSTHDSVTLGPYTGTVVNEASLNVYLNTQWIALLPSALQDQILNITYNVGPASEDSYALAVIHETDFTWTGKIGLVTAVETLNAGFSKPTFNTANINNNWITSYATSTLDYWTITPNMANNWDVWVIHTSSLISSRRANRLTQPPVNFTAMPVFAISSNHQVMGAGTQANPYILNIN